MHGRALFLALLVASSCVQARDLSVFNVLRLDMPGIDALRTPRETWAVDTQLGYQNTWSMSPNVQDYFETRPVTRRLDPEDIEDIRALPYEKFLVDLEMGVLDVAFHRRLDANWSAYGIVSLVSYHGGFMDSGIESFHDALGFREYVRNAVPRNQATVLVETGRTSRLLQGAPSGGFLDPTLGVRYVTGDFTFDAAVKIPIDGTREFLSNGSVDVGLQAAWRGTWGAHSGYVSLAGVSTTGGGVIETSGRYFVPTLRGGYEYAFGQGTSAVLQADVSRYALDSSDTDIGGLRKEKTQVKLGVRHRYGRSLFTFMVTEGFAAYNGLPDLGIQLGWTID